jgi:hypothetical protein
VVISELVLVDSGTQVTIALAHRMFTAARPYTKM